MKKINYSIIATILVMSTFMSCSKMKPVTGYIDIGKAKIYYEEMGEGYPLILIHAGLLDNRMWDQQFEFFAKDYRVIRYDVRVHGLSKSEPDTFYHYEDLKLLMNELQIEKAAICGLSMGGKIAIDFAMEYPENVSGLILVSSGISGYTFESEEYIKNNEKLMEAYQKNDLEMVIEYFQRSWTDGPYRKPEEVDSVIRNKTRSMAMQTAKNWNPQSVSLEPETPSLYRLREVDIPAAIIIGNIDMPGILEIADLIEKDLKGSVKHVLKDCAHMVNMEKPEEFNGIVIDFLNSIKEE